MFFAQNTYWKQKVAYNWKFTLLWLKYEVPSRTTLTHTCTCTHAHILKAIPLGVLCIAQNSHSSTFDNGFRSYEFSALFKVCGCSPSVRKRGSLRSVECSAFPPAMGRRPSRWTPSCDLCVMCHSAHDSHVFNTGRGQSPVDVVRFLQKYPECIWRMCPFNARMGVGKTCLVLSLLTVEPRGADKNSRRRGYKKNLLDFRVWRSATGIHYDWHFIPSQWGRKVEVSKNYGFFFFKLTHKCKQS